MVLWVWNVGRTQRVARTGSFSAQLVWRVLVGFARMPGPLTEGASWDAGLSWRPALSVWSLPHHVVPPAG